MPWQTLHRKDSEQLKEEIEKMAETVQAALQEEADKAERELESLLGIEEESASKKASKSDKRKKQKAKKKDMCELQEARVDELRTAQKERDFANIFHFLCQLLLTRAEIKACLGRHHHHRFI